MQENERNAFRTEQALDEEEDCKEAIRIAKQALIDLGFEVDEARSAPTHLTASIPEKWNGLVELYAQEYSFDIVMQLKEKRPKISVPRKEWGYCFCPMSWEDWVITEWVGKFIEGLKGLSKSEELKSRLYNKIHGYFKNSYVYE
jgi:hypothetical protein